MESSCFNVKIRGVIFSSSSGWAVPSTSPSAAKIHIHSFTKPGVGMMCSNFRKRRAVYPVSSSNSRRAATLGVSSGSLRPATSSHRNSPTVWRYWRISNTRPSSKTGITTTDPGCTTMSRSARTPPGSITVSRCTRNTLPVYRMLLSRTFARAFAKSASC